MTDFRKALSRKASGKTPDKAAGQEVERAEDPTLDLAQGKTRTLGTLRRRARISADSMLDEVLAGMRKVPPRSREALHQQYPDLSPDEVADELIRAAARATARVGAAVGTWAVLPFVPAFPFEIAAETVAVVGIEVRLVAELHEVYGLAVPGAPARRMTAYLVAWGERRSAVLAPAGFVLAAGTPLRKRLSRRLAQRTGRSAFSLAPLLTGAAAGAVLNRRETRRLGRDVMTSLRADAGVVRTWGEL